MNNTNIEARAKVEDMEKLSYKLKEHDAKVIEEYSFKDTLYMPTGIIWDLDKQSMKIREFSEKDVQIIYGMFEWDKGIKVQTFGVKKSVKSSQKASEIMRSLNLERIVSYSRKGKVYSLKDNNCFVLEKLDYIGDYIEIESNDLYNIEHLLNILPVKKVERSIPSLVYEAYMKDK